MYSENKIKIKINNKKILSERRTYSIEDHETEVQINTVEGDGLGMAAQVVLLLVHHNIYAGFSHSIGRN